MSLLNRIAVKNGNPRRKATATILLRNMDKAKISHWHKDLKAEIRRKQEHSPFSVKP